MNEFGAARWAQTALRDGFGLQELADFFVAGGRRAGLVVAEELPLGQVVECELRFELGKVGQGGALPQHAAMELSAGLLQADSVGGVGFGFERHWLAVDDLVLPHPTSVRLANLDLDAGILLSPSPNELLHFAESFDVFVVRSVLAYFELAIGLDEGFGQAGEAMQEEAIGDEHQVAVGPMLSREQKVLDHVRVQQWLAAQESETCRTQAMGPERIVGVSLLDGRHHAGEMMIRIVAALLAREIATVGQVVFQRG